MKDKSKAKPDESPHDKSSTSELKSLGSTSSITIPKASPVKKMALAGGLVLGLGAGGYFAVTSEIGKNLVNSFSASEESDEGAKDVSDVSPAEEDPKDAMAPQPGDDPLSRDAAVPPVSAPPVVPQAPPSLPVAKPAEVPAKKVVKKAKDSKAGHTNKANISKKAKAIANLKKSSKAKKSKAVAKGKGKGKKPIAGHASVGAASESPSVPRSTAP